MKHDLIQLAQQYPGLTVSVSLDDLLTAGRTIADELLDSLDRTVVAQPAPAKEVEAELNLPKSLRHYATKAMDNE